MYDLIAELRVLYYARLPKTQRNAAAVLFRPAFTDAAGVNKGRSKSGSGYEAVSPQRTAPHPLSNLHILHLPVKVFFTPLRLECSPRTLPFRICAMM